MSTSPPPDSSNDTLPQAELYATCGAGLEAVLAAELRDLGIERVQTAGAGVRFGGGLAAGYRACLWSRVANRILLPIHQGIADSPETLYELVQQIDWGEHLEVDGTLAVDFFTASSAITHSRYGALKVKDAVVDQFRERLGRRPDVDRETPDVRINVYLFRNRARVSIDLSGSSLHRRGYRDAGGPAPLKENLAAALLLAVDWPQAIRRGLPLVDPMCGSGTLLIEAAMMACDQAPGLLRDYWGFRGWKGHDEVLWQGILLAANQRIRASPVAIAGADHDPEVIDNCRRNLRLAGLSELVDVESRSLVDGRPTTLAAASTGFLISNPPYGHRLGADADSFAELGTRLSQHYAGWHGALFTATDSPWQRSRLPLTPRLQVRNGGIDCVLLTGDIPATGRAHQGTIAVAVDATPFVNRLKKNLRALKGWRKQGDIHAWRVYDADLPEFAVAIDLFETDQKHAVVQEYQAPASVNLAMAQARLDALMLAVPDALDVDPDRVYLKIREVQSGRQQYQRRNAGKGRVSLVNEFDALLEVNFTDYLDIGLFLDHRPVRRYIRRHSKDKRFLNLFAYTGAATVAAVMGGATSSVSVDTSNRYCQWAIRNLDRNGAAAESHEVVRQDAISWLQHAAVGMNGKTHFDLVLLDPPTYSNSSAVEVDWNVQRDHVAAIDACLQVMAPGGLLIFSTNYRRFRLNPQLREDDSRGIRLEDRSSWSIDRDFQRNSRIHQCWFIHKL